MTVIIIIFSIAMLIFTVFTRDTHSRLNMGLLLFSIVLNLLGLVSLWFCIPAQILFVLNWTFWHFSLPKGLSIFYGVPGSGKTTLAAYIARDFLKKGRKVFCNVPIVDTLKVVRSDIGSYQISDGVLLFDEAGVDFNNRFGNQKGSQFKLTEAMTQWIKYYRHYQISHFACFTQREDIDITIRGICDRVYILSKTGLPFIVQFQLCPFYLDVDVPPNSSIGQLCSGLKKSPFGIHFVYSPPLWKSFDTYDAPKLPEKEFIKWGNETRFTEDNNPF